jgi:hypothetical protein
VLILKTEERRENGWFGCLAFLAARTLSQTTQGGYFSARVQDHYLFNSNTKQLVTLILRQRMNCNNGTNMCAADSRHHGGWSQPNSPHPAQSQNSREQGHAGSPIPYHPTGMGPTVRFSHGPFFPGAALHNDPQVRAEVCREQGHAGSPNPYHPAGTMGPPAVHFSPLPFFPAGAAWHNHPQVRAEVSGEQGHAGSLNPYYPAGMGPPPAVHLSHVPLFPGAAWHNHPQARAEVDRGRSIDFYAVRDPLLLASWASFFRDQYIMAHTKNVVDDRVGDDDMHSKSFPKKEVEGFITSSRAEKPLQKKPPQRKSGVRTIRKKKY